MVWTLFGGAGEIPFPSYRVCEVDAAGKPETAIKRITDGMILNAHQLLFF